MLHRVIWEDHNGKIPWDCIIHHKDGDSSNNDISNLECVKARDHLRTFHNGAYINRKNIKTKCERCGNMFLASRKGALRCESCKCSGNIKFYNMFCDLDPYGIEEPPFL